MVYTSFDNIGLVKVLKFLKSHKSEYLSGQDLSDVLKISRVAVWKHIKKIRSLGYKIESKQKSGYRFVKTTNKLLPWEISSDLKTNYVGKRVYYFEDIDSTQNFALQISSNKKENGTLVIAEKQNDGKGRMNRKWFTPKGGISFSVIIHPNFNISDSTLIPIGTAVALSKSIQKILGVKTNVKWPNDLTINNKKVAGILVDASFQSNNIESVVIGIGINYKINPKNVKDKIKKTENFYGVETLLKNGKNTNPVDLIRQFTFEFEKIVELLTNGKKTVIIKDWTIRSNTIHKKITISTDNGKISGIAKKIDADGALILSTKNGSMRILVGDVSH